MNIKFLDKVYDQILSETRIDNNDLNGVLGEGLIYFPFLLLGPLLISDYKQNFFFPLINQRIYFHCKDVYGLNKEETEYICEKYKEEITTLMEDKELV
jgi:hypothetical protein